MQTTELLQTDEDGIARAADLLRAGELVAFPTETVYGLGADATQDHAVAQVYAVKARPTFNPLIVHVPSLAVAEGFAEFTQEDRRLAKAFWPGPLTLVLRLLPDAGISELVTAGTSRLAVRVPASPVAIALLEKAGRPLAAPSANPSGRISPTSPDHVLKGLGGQISAILDAGPSDVGVESTVVATGEPPFLLRPGGLAKKDIETALGRELSIPSDDDGPASPGRQLSHYAPAAALRMDATRVNEDEVMLGFGTIAGDYSLSESGDVVEAAANLFRLLHTLDDLGRPIAVAPIPDSGLGQAINDRLRRASAPR